MSRKAIPTQGKHYGSMGNAQVELTISCSSLANLDLLSKSDPMVVVYVPQLRGAWQEVGRTETIRDDLNPRFIKSFILEYRFAEVQPLKFVVYDVDNNRGLDKQDLIGDMETSLAEVMSAPGQCVTRELRHRKDNRGFVTVMCEEWAGHQSDVVQFHLGGQSLPSSTSLMGSINTFIVLSRTTVGDGDDDQVAEGGAGGRGEGGRPAVPVYRSECQKGSGVTWSPFTIQVERLCRHEQERPIEVSLFEWKFSGGHVLLARAYLTLAKIREAGAQGGRGPSVTFAPIAGDKSCGSLELLQCGLSVADTFVDFVKGGCEVSLMVALDFSASNKAPGRSDSLHFIGTAPGAKPNPYVRAVQSVGSILAAYDSDGRFPVLGFGAKIPPAMEVSHCFPVTFDPEEHQVDGVDSVVEVYEHAVDKVLFAGPTVMSQVIRYATAHAASARNTQQAQKYYVLLIITDGAVDIQDMERTVDSIVEASDLPLSIVIVGVGPSNFQYMKILDADETPLKHSNGTVARRDLVQFVRMLDFEGRSMAQLANATMEEIPRQVLQYFSGLNIRPNPPRTATVTTVGGVMLRNMRSRIASRRRGKSGKRGKQPWPVASLPSIGGDSVAGGLDSEMGPGDAASPLGRRSSGGAGAQSWGNSRESMGSGTTPSGSLERKVSAGVASPGGVGGQGQAGERDKSPGAMGGCCGALFGGMGRQQRTSLPPAQPPVAPGAGGGSPARSPGKASPNRTSSSRAKVSPMGSIAERGVGDEPGGARGSDGSRERISSKSGRGGGGEQRPSRDDVRAWKSTGHLERSFSHGRGGDGGGGGGGGGGAGGAELRTRKSEPVSRSRHGVDLASTRLSSDATGADSDRRARKELVRSLSYHLIVKQYKEHGGSRRRRGSETTADSSRQQAAEGTSARHSSGLAGQPFDSAQDLLGGDGGGDEDVDLAPGREGRRSPREGKEKSSRRGPRRSKSLIGPDMLKKVDAAEGGPMGRSKTQLAQWASSGKW